MNKFNLTEEPWIPCLMLKDNETKDLSLFEVLGKAHEIKEITDNSPLVVVSLHRLLLAILHRNFGPKTFEEWKNLWKQGSWNAEKLKNYFDKWKERFNLFDEERPFYQYPQVLKAGGIEGNISPIENLMQEKSVGANATLFDHSFKEKVTIYPFSVVARYLIARQAFSFGGGNNFPFNLSDSTIKSGFNVLATGKNLFETLALNLVVYHRDKPIPIQDDNDDVTDIPFWEREKLVQATEKDKDGNLPLGYLDYLTWQCRRIKLIKNQQGEGVGSCQLQQNFKLKNDISIFDPFKVYIKGEEGYFPLKLDEEKSLWRNSHTLLKQTNSIEGRSSLFSHLAKVESLVRNEEIKGLKTHTFMVSGVISDQANVLLWISERLPLSLEYLNNDKLLADIETAIKFADEIGFALEKSMKTLRKEINIKAWETSIKSVKAQDRPKREKQLANQFPALSVYWSALEIAFQRLASSLVTQRETALTEWFCFVYKTANDAFDNTAKSLGNSVSEQKAIVKADNKFYWSKRNLIDENAVYRDYLPNYKTKGGSE